MSGFCFLLLCSMGLRWRFGSTPGEKNAGPPVDEIIKIIMIGGLKARKVAEHYIGQTSSSTRETEPWQDVEVAYQT